MALSDLPRSMGWGEAWRLTQQLMVDTTSHVTAAVAGWSYPVGREVLVAMDTYDVLAKKWLRNPKPYPRPWPDQATKKTARPLLTQDEVFAALVAHGHSLPTTDLTGVEAVHG